MPRISTEAKLREKADLQRVMPVAVVTGQGRLAKGRDKLPEEWQLYLGNFVYAA